MTATYQEKFEDQRNYKDWAVWLMRNCADCSTVPCAIYTRNYALAQTWGKDFSAEPNCPEKVLV